MSERPRHPDKHIEKALRYAEGLGWRVEKSAGGHAHAWGKLLCPFSTREGCKVFVNGTPRVPMNHARQIQNKVDSCPHQPDTSEEKPR